MTDSLNGYYLFELKSRSNWPRSYSGTGTAVTTHRKSLCGECLTMR